MSSAFGQHREGESWTRAETGDGKEEQRRSQTPVWASFIRLVFSHLVCHPFPVVSPPLHLRSTAPLASDAKGGKRTRLP